MFPPLVAEDYVIHDHLVRLLIVAKLVHEVALRFQDRMERFDVCVWIWHLHRYSLVYDAYGLEHLVEHVRYEL